MAVICVAALYRFTRFDDPEVVRDALHAVCAARDVKGTLLIAQEGMNGTIAGGDAAIDAVLATIRALPGCADVEVKRSRAPVPPFARLKIRVKREIVTMGLAGLDPATQAGDYVCPADWNRLTDDPDTIVIDTRNDYEVALGSFDGAIDPGIRTFRDFPVWFRAFRAERERHGPMPPIAMFCTGGIRCEKATAFVKAEGLDRVYHLRGGILAYLENVPAEESRWQGECFVFDERVTVDAALAPSGRRLCPQCQRPAEDGCLTCAAV